MRNSILILSMILAMAVALALVISPRLRDTNPDASGNEPPHSLQDQ